MLSKIIFFFRQVTSFERVGGEGWDVLYLYCNALVQHHTNPTTGSTADFYIFMPCVPSIHNIMYPYYIYATFCRVHYNISPSPPQCPSRQSYCRLTIFVVRIIKMYTRCRYCHTLCVCVCVCAEKPEFAIRRIL